MAASIDPYPKYLDWLRYLSAFLLLLYGSSKLLGRQFSVPPELALRSIGSLSGHDLVWYFYSHSHVYATILGSMQVAGAGLLLFRRTTLLGAAVVLPMIANILMINVFFFIAWGATCTSTLIFAAMVAILWHDRQALLGVFWTRQAGEPAGVVRRHRITAAAVVLSVIVFMAVGSWLATAHSTLGR